ncbi:Chromosome partitioning protein ParA [Candidatus Paraburkholderia kirkii UZHbot1]|uniref:Chromosome partitioning protein ParA n=1 Tax=Candidatus Paraburkholderia kirkii UZHbot1 TaxID=1055526 RepID=G4MG45_9BURK|nr:Chromosome partitioning protein ParA [Candidatus Paraburkholderia kirkii UZHbot1]
MTVIVVENPKGGVGKNTLATNLAGYYFAAQGEWVALADLDKPRSSHAWLSLRVDTLPKIEEWNIDVDTPGKPPKGLEKAVVDTPAGVHGNRLALSLQLADKMTVPLQPSMFDILATQDFLAKLAKEKAVRKGAIEIGVVGMRVDARTRSADQLHRFVEGLDLPVLGFLRATRRTTCSSPRTASRSGMWRRVASRRISSNGRRSLNGSKRNEGSRRPCGYAGFFLAKRGDQVQFCVGT